MNYNAESALSSLVSKRKLCPTPQCSKESDFNIFKALKIQNNEVLICRFLAALLEPMGSHKMGITPLKEFLKIIGISADDAELEQASIVLEKTTDKYRRIDIVIYINNKIIPIEAKVWYYDREKQLSDYYNYLFKSKKETSNKIYYLTPDGHAPSPESLVNLKLNEDVICISFKEHIRNWVKKLKNDSNVDDEIKTILKYFEEVVDAMCKEYNELNSIYTALSLNDNQEYTTSDEIKLIIDCLKHKDELMDKILQQMLLKNIIADGYLLEKSADNKKDRNFTDELVTVKKGINTLLQYVLEQICI